MTQQSPQKRSFLCKQVFLALCCGTLFFCVTAAQAQSPRPKAWKITADKMTRLGKPENIVAEGNVILEPDRRQGGPPMVITADWVRYNIQDNTVSARGNLTFHSDSEEATAAEGSLNLENDTAVFSDATLFIPESNLHFKGSRVEKTGELTYHFSKSSMTTCDMPDDSSPPWSFSAAEAGLDIEGVAVLKHSVLRVKGVPIFYFPYMIYPVNEKRHSGFLLPEFSQSSRSGTGLITPFFVNLSPSADLTLYPGYMAKRGVTAGLEFRYTGEKGAKAAVAFNYLRDSLEDDFDDNFKDDGYLRTRQDRYWLRAKMDKDFGDELIAHLDLDMVSDRDFLQEFEKNAVGFEESNDNFESMFERGFMEQTVPFRESRLQLSKTWPSVFFGGEVVGVDDLRDNDAAQTHLQTLPRLFFDGRYDLPLSSATLLWNSQYDYFWRERGVGGHRFDVNPRLIMPLPLGGSILEGAFSAGLRHTMYQVESHGPQFLDWGHDEQQNRTSWDVSANLGATLSRDFAVNLGDVSWLSHAIRPEVSYEYLDSGDNYELPQFDSIDTLSARNLINYEVKNDFLMGGERGDGTPFSRYVGCLTISQSYDLHEQRRDLNGSEDKHRPFSDINLTFDAFPLPNLETRYEVNYNVYGEGISSYDILNRYTSGRGDIFSLDYRFVKGTEINQLNGSFNTRLSDTLFLEGELIRSLDSDETVRSEIGLLYHPDCWAVKLMASHSSDEDQVAVVFSIISLGESFSFGLGGGDGGITVVRDDPY